MTSHIRSALTQTQLTIPIHKGALALGTWQGIYLFEHRERPHNRSVIVHLLSE
jgi:secondary thiamine-phosphate synthase enzyme